MNSPEENIVLCVYVRVRKCVYQTGRNSSYSVRECVRKGRGMLQLQ